jgi:hypothetical protein
MSRRAINVQALNCADEPQGAGGGDRGAGGGLLRGDRRARVGAVEAGADVIEGGPYRARVAVATQMLGEQALGLQQLGCRQ